MHVPLYPPKVPARVVYVIDEPLRKGFAYGTLPGHPETGEEAFIVEYRDDDSVWLIDPRVLAPGELDLLGRLPAGAPHAGGLHRALRARVVAVRSTGEDP